MTLEPNTEQSVVVEGSITIAESEGTISQNDVQAKVVEPQSNTKRLSQQEIVEIKERSGLLNELLSMESKIHYSAAKDIVKLPSLISRNGTAIIKQGTINFLQGKTGTHKTRLSELLISLLIDKTGSGNYLYFQKAIETPVVVCYIDTERNTTEELPHGVQSIKLKAGYRRDELIPNFRCTSIKQIDRGKRLKAVECFISKVRNQNPSKPIFTVMDVVTDCCANFNNVEDSLKLFDFIAKLCEQYEATFLLIIHENPFSDKARGHIGTEGQNKASAVLSIGFERVNNKDVNIISLKFLKLRGAARPSTIYLNYNEDSAQLELASNDMMSRMLAEKELTTDIDSVAESIEEIMTEDREYAQKELLTALKVKYKWVDNTLKARLKAIAETKRELTNLNSEPCTLEVKVSSGKVTTYRLVAIIVTGLETEELINEQIRTTEE